LRGDKQFDAARDTGLSSDEAGALEGHDHLMDRWRCDLEMALHVGFGGGTTEDARISVDEGQILALLVSEGSSAGHRRTA